MHRWWRCFLLLAICQRALRYLFLDSRRIRNREKGTYYSVPTWLTSPCYGVITDIVPDEETCLELLVSSPPYSEDCWLTSSTDHPRMAALKYSSSVNSDPLRISAVSQTDNPRFNFPSSQPYEFHCSGNLAHTARNVVVQRLSISFAQVFTERETDLLEPTPNFLWWSSTFNVINQLLPQYREYIQELLPLSSFIHLVTVCVRHCI